MMQFNKVLASYSHNQYKANAMFILIQENKDITRIMYVCAECWHPTDEK